MSMDNRDSSQKNFNLARDRFDSAKMLFSSYRPIPIPHGEKIELINVFSCLNSSFDYLSRAFDVLADGMASLSRPLSESIGDMEDELEDLGAQLNRIEKAVTVTKRGPAGR
jgi:hypothetical protein